MTALVVFDIEAVPDFEVGRGLLGRPDDAPDAEIRRMLGERYARDGEDSLLLLSRRSLSRGGGEPSTASLAGVGAEWVLRRVLSRWERRPFNGTCSRTFCG